MIDEHVRPFLASGARSPEIALTVAVAHFTPVRLRFLSVLLPALDREGVESVVLGGARCAQELLASDGWKLGADAAPLGRGVDAHAELAEWAVARLDAATQVEPASALMEQLVRAGTCTDLCLLSALLVLDGTIDLDGVERERLSEACGAVEPAVRSSRELLEELLAGDRAPGLRDLAGAWGHHPDDDRLLREIYDARADDAE